MLPPERQGLVAKPEDARVGGADYGSVDATATVDIAKVSDAVVHVDAAPASIDAAMPMDANARLDSSRECAGDRDCAADEYCSANRLCTHGCRAQLDNCPAGEVCEQGSCVARSVVPPGYVRIEPGVFLMGSPIDEPFRENDERQHQVTISRAFALKATEVTQAEWQTVMGANPSSFPSCGGDCPVDTISWYDAVEYVNRLSDFAGIERCYDPAWNFNGLACLGYRLPTEAEWEYAARAGTQTAYHNGPNTLRDCRLDPNLDLVAWYCGNANDGTHSVASKAPNPWGLYDMHGNVWEWVNDLYAAYPAGAAVDPIGPAASVYRIFRGGSWFDGAHNARSAYRAAYSADDQVRNHFGLRPARTLQ